MYVDDVLVEPRHLQRRVLIRRSVRNGAIVAGLITAALAIGAAGYRVFEGMSWLDATMNAAMILTGMGPAIPVERAEAKIFATVYALLSGVFFLTMVAVLLAPAARHFLHRFHLELDESRRKTKPRD
jgi:TRAP-type C4-dicarboxylate transport system permease small subunit